MFLPYYNKSQRIFLYSVKLCTTWQKLNFFKCSWSVKLCSTWLYLTIWRTEGLPILPLIVNYVVVQMTKNIKTFWIHFSINTITVGEIIIATTKMREKKLCHPIIHFSKISLAILDFSLLLLVKLSIIILFASFLVLVLCFFFKGFLSKVIALPFIAIAIVVALSRS